MSPKLLLVSASLLSFVASLNLLIGIVSFNWVYFPSAILFGISGALQFFMVISENRKKEVNTLPKPTKK